MLATDKEVESHPAEGDIEKEHRLDGTDTARFVDAMLTQKGEWTDEIHAVEREEEDRARTQEYFKNNSLPKLSLKVSVKKRTTIFLMNEPTLTQSSLQGINFSRLSVTT